MAVEIMSVVKACLNNGVILTVLDDGKLSIKGNKMVPAVAELKYLVQRDRAAVLATITELNDQHTSVPPSVIETPPPDDLSFTLDNIEALPIEPISMPPLDANIDDLTFFVGSIVCDSDMAILMQRVLVRGWELHTTQCEDGWYIRRSTAKAA